MSRNSVPEARNGLRKLWDLRPGSDDWFYQWDGGFIHDLGEALLLAGDDAPCEKKGFVNYLGGESALRIYCHSPNPAVRAAVEEWAGDGETRPIAGELLDFLAARGERTTRVANVARQLRTEYWWAVTGKEAPWLLLCAALVVAAWIPRARGNRVALAASLIMTGLVLRLVTVDVAGRVWLPVAGDALFLIAALLHGGWIIRPLAAGLLLTSGVQFARPHTTTVAIVGMGLFALYLAAISLDQLSRERSNPVSIWEALPHLAAWLILIVPLSVNAAVAPFFPGGASIEPILQIRGEWGCLFVLALMVSPPAIVLAWRLRELKKPQVPPLTSPSADTGTPLPA